MDELEKKLDDVFVKKAPYQLPVDFKKWIVQYSPIIGLIFGVIGLLLTWGFWNAGHVLNSALTQLDSINNIYGINSGVHHPNLGVAYWLALVSLGAWSVLNIMAYPGLKARKKAGWNLLFYAALANGIYDICYGLYYSNLFDIVSRLIGVVIGLYFLFQIRSFYLGAKTATVAGSAKTEPDSLAPTKKN